MPNLIKSKKPSRCSKCNSTEYKIEYQRGPDPNNFYLDINKLMCARCGHISTGELKEDNREEIEMSDEKYQEMLAQHQEFKTYGYIKTSTEKEESQN